MVKHATNLQCVLMLDNLVANSSNEVGNQSQQSLQWTLLHKHQS